MTSSVSHKFQKIRVCKALKVTLPGDDYATSGLSNKISPSLTLSIGFFFRLVSKKFVFFVR